ncbi:hypothetical protein BDV24DRAFT_131260 [Aspergillus arachidicola]|uniref:Uncharacterized protein n=1 Tax=Aspergillus arachidicola TaxID=656916 RepID=A0A5N6Y9C7_9EURO|nr:hypothetical protein BDV24DRAFT_131260 [Aspergillus arachidicola]
MRCLSARTWRLPLLRFMSDGLWISFSILTSIPRPEIRTRWCIAIRPWGKDESDTERNPKFSWWTSCGCGSWARI